VTGFGEFFWFSSARWRPPWGPLALGIKGWHHVRVVFPFFCLSPVSDRKALFLSPHPVSLPPSTPIRRTLPPRAALNTRPNRFPFFPPPTRTSPFSFLCPDPPPRCRSGLLPVCPPPKPIQASPLCSSFGWGAEPGLFGTLFFLLFCLQLPGFFPSSFPRNFTVFFPLFSFLVFTRHSFFPPPPLMFDSQ